MDQSPVEILSHIINHLNLGRGHNQLGPYASISRSWQAEVERRTFQCPHLTIAELDDFYRAFLGKRLHRMRYLRSLEISFILLPRRSPGCCDVERIPRRGKVVYLEEQKCKFQMAYQRLMYLVDIE
ncbi:hypothetical protein BDV95DRAFT_297332 [Massariosphaeria phaeospora]|uniref:F-box domain-containing protein n=1 Tax=Massariosphaeria phaeospora TaxID=100035 RepID=A0A7C8II22_9PLEO|nr:hypothetical protein BDV95DRAFT_297332 [Massariosphaeria phaeospora]